MGVVLESIGKEGFFFVVGRVGSEVKGGCGCGDFWRDGEKLGWPAEMGFDE